MADDIQVARVDFQLDGAYIGSDHAAPFEYPVIAPVLSAGKTDFTLAARAVDSGGNVGWSETLLLQLAPDTTPPEAIRFDPADTSVVAGPCAFLRIFFDEPIATESLTIDHFQVLGAGLDGEFDTDDDSQPMANAIGFLECAGAVVLEFEPGLGHGRYRVTIDTGVTDRAGNPLAEPVDFEFSVVLVELLPGTSFVAADTFASRFANSYGFFLEAGQRVFFDIQEGGDLAPRYYLRHEDGTEVFNHSLHYDSGVLTVPQSGRHILTLDNEDTDHVGPYQFQLWDVPAPQSFEIAIGDLISDGLPGAGAGRIETPGVLDIYTFEGQAGQRIFVDVQSGGSLAHQCVIVDPAGETLYDRAIHWDSGVLTLPLTGQYTLTIGNEGEDHFADYRFQLWDVPERQSFGIAIGDVISDGVPGAGAGRIETPGALDVYTFEGQAGQRVFLDVQSGGSLAHQAVIQDPNGQTLYDRAIHWDSGVLTLPLTGQYTLTIGNEGDDYFADYSFQLWDVPEPQVFEIAVGDVISHGVPGVGAGQIESPGVLDVYNFEGQAGQRVFFDVQSGGSLAHQAVIEDPDGETLYDRAIHWDSGVLTLPLSGQYTLTIGNEGDDYFADYSFQLWDVPEPQVFEIGVGDIVSDGVPEAGAGRIESPGVLDVYTFEGQAGQRVFLDILSGGSLAHQAVIEDPDGETLYDRAIHWDSGVLTLPLSGQYTLTIGNEGSDDIAEYSFQLWDVSDPQVFEISLGDIVSDGVPGAGAGRIETPGVLDQYTILPEVGDEVIVGVLQGSISLRVTVIDEEGNELHDGSVWADSPPMVFVPGRVYTLTIGNESSDFTGTYSFQVASPDP